MSKHRIHAIDEALDNNASWTPDFPHKKYVRELTQRARRFVFDDEASRYLGRFMASCGDIILNNRQFARPPFEVTYVEISLDLALKAMKEVNPEIRSTVDTEGYVGADTYVGFLFHGNRVYECAASAIQKAFLSPIVFDLNTPWGGKNQFAFGGKREEWMRLTFLLGTTVNDVQSEEQRQDVMSSVKITDYRGRDFLELDVAQGMSGCVRNMWAALLLLNQQKITKLQFEKPKAVLYRGKRRVYAAHNVVTIDLLGHKTIRQAMTSGMRESPRRHEVRGHWVRYHLDRSCDHVFPMEPDVDDRFPCKKCGGFRVWRKDSIRGDASKGWVFKDYDVTAKGRKGVDTYAE